MKELPTKRRIMEMCINQPGCTDDQLRKLHYAFRKLVVLKAIPSAIFTEDAKRIFIADHATFLEKMLRINNIVKSLGIDIEVFRNPYDFETSSEDYDYYYELKTPKQLIEEESARKNTMFSEKQEDL